MKQQVAFYFDVGSPASYLAWTQLPGLCRDAGAELLPKPMLLGAVFQATGNASPVSVPAKGRYTRIDMARYAERYGVPLVMNPHFPIHTLTLMRITTGLLLRERDRLDDFLVPLFKALWVDGVNLNEPARVAEVGAAAGFDPGALLTLANDAEVKATLRATTDEAIARGVFGAPTMFVGDAMYFGQDRLDFVREELVARSS